MFNDTQRVIMTSGAVTFYDEGITGTLYQATMFPNAINSATISNDTSTDDIQWSFDGATLEGNILPGESITANVSRKKQIYIKSTLGGGDYRLWGF